MHGSGCRVDSMRKPTVAVIIPAFDEEEFIAQSVQSALRQTYGSVDVLVVDDDSTDSTREIVERLPDARLLLNERNGPCAARNLGAKVSEAEYLLFLDADDLLSPDTVERLIGAWGGGRMPICGVFRLAAALPASGRVDRAAVRDEAAAARGRRASGLPEWLVLSSVCYSVAQGVVRACRRLGRRIGPSQPEWGRRHHDEGVLRGGERRLLRREHCVLPALSRPPGVRWREGTPGTPFWPRERSSSASSGCSATGSYGRSTGTRSACAITW